MDEARGYVDEFVIWYNTTHKHSGIKYVTLGQRHQGMGKAILNKRNEDLVKGYTLSGINVA